MRQRGGQVDSRRLRVCCDFVSTIDYIDAYEFIVHLNLILAVHFSPTGFFRFCFLLQNAKGIRAQQRAYASLPHLAGIENGPPHAHGGVLPILGTCFRATPLGPRGSTRGTP